MHGKRFAMQKGAPRHGKGSREVATTSKQEFPNANDSSETLLNNIPIIKLAENATLLPKYTSILSRTPDDGVNMDDLLQLQLDFEKLLSTCALRNRYLRAESDSIDRNEERRGDTRKAENVEEKKTKSYDKGGLKRKRIDEKVKIKDIRNGNPVKKLFTVHEIPKINRVKNETSDKFWATVEPYCAPVTNSHAMFLDKLIEECSQEIDVKIPELGDYYANEWNDSAITNEQELGTGTKNVGSDTKKNGISAVVDTFSNPKTQRLFAMLIEERVTTSFPNITGKLKPSDFGSIKSQGGTRTGLCTDRRLIKNLVEQGILTAEDLPKNMPEDEILQEIKKCQQELATVNEYNVEELNRLKAIVVKDLKRQELKSALDEIDNQVMELYKKVLLAKQEYVEDVEAKKEKYDKENLSKVLKEFELQTDLLLKQQTQLQHQIAELNEC